MSKAGKVLFLFAFLFAGGLVLLRTAYGGWLDFMWVPFVLSVALFIAGSVMDRSALTGFFLLRTTKHGLNMGAAILIAVVALICVNVLGVRYDKKFDWTSDKLNSLSEQSVKAAKAVQTETEVLLLYTPEDAQSAESVRDIGTLVNNYQSINKQIKYMPFDARQRPDLTKKYEMRGPLSLFLIQGEKNVRVAVPTEEGLTRGLLQLSHDKKKIIYFMTGHNEAELESRQPDGLLLIKEDLSSTYEAKTLSLLENENKIPADAGVIAIVGPKLQYLESELQALREFARKGGRLLIAIDPGVKHNLAQLTKSLGIEFNNDFVVDPRTTNMVGATTVGLFDKADPITQPLPPNGFAIFYKASSLRVAKEAGAGLIVSELAQADQRTLKQTELAPLRVTDRASGPHLVGVSVKGRISADAPEFHAIVYGDSDFMANGLYAQYLNRDLVMNSVAALMQDPDLISIRPKELKATKMRMLDTDFAVYSLAVLFAIPVFMFMAGGAVWFRRRLA